MTLEKMKVYELAKELGMESIALLERLRQLDIDVKSHMSSLGTEEIRIARDHLSKEKAVAVKTAKAVAKKAVASETTVEKRVTSTVIRRRTKNTGADGQADSIPQVVSPKQEQAEQQLAADEATHHVASTVTYDEPELTKTALEADEAEVTPIIEEQHIESHVTHEAAMPAEQLEAAAPMIEAPAAEVVEADTSESTATVKFTAPSFSFDIIKVHPKGTPVSDEPRPAGLRPVAPGSSLPAPRPRQQINVISKAVPGAFEPRPRPGLNRNTYHRPIVALDANFQRSAPGGFARPVGSTGPGRPPMGGAGAAGAAGAGAGLAGLPGAAPSGRYTDRNRFNEEENLKKKTGLTRGAKEELPVEDIKLGDYRAKKELIFLPRRKKVSPTRAVMHTQITIPAEHKRLIKIEGSVTVADLANRMGVKATDVIKKLIGMGVMANLNQTIDFDTATLIAAEFKFEIENVAFKEETLIAKDEDKDEDRLPRPPIVTVMGHVDHGKTSLLDAIRKAKVADGEAGGITQHIGAYSVNLDGKVITFIDTPGHAAFTQMRARGANVTDIVILVVAADDGVMPQTREAIDHAKSAGVPLIVAVNKMDKASANRDRILKELAELDLLPEEWGGQTMVVNVSALKKTGIKELLEAILLQAEVLDLKANPSRHAEGTIIEAKLDKSRGPTATVLVKRGTLRVGDTVVAGPFVGRVRAMIDDVGQPLKTIGPSYAAEILGLEGVPVAGDTFNAVADDSAARDLQNHRLEETRKKEASKQGKLTLEEIFAKIQKGDLKELPIIVKTDVFGSTEAVRDSLVKLSTPQVKVKILSSAVGGITESDVLLASASGALIFGFNVRPDNNARQLAERENVQVKTYAIIYELIEDVKKAMAGLLPKRAVEKYLGRAEVRSVFSIPSFGVIGGCSVIDGKIQRNAQVRLLRESRVIFTGKLASLRRFKDDAKEVAQGFECGIGIDNYRDLKMGDIIEAFTIEMITQDLESAAAAGAEAHAAT